VVILGPSRSLSIRTMPKRAPNGAGVVRKNSLQLPSNRGADTYLSLICYMRDPDGYLIEVGQYTQIALGNFKTWRRVAGLSTETRYGS